MLLMQAGDSLTDVLRVVNITSKAPTAIVACSMNNALLMRLVTLVAN